MIKKIPLFLIIGFSNVLAMVTDFAVHTPMRGWASRPGKEHFYISLYYQSLSSNHAFNKSGEKVALEDYISISNVSPHIQKSMAVADVMLGLTPTFGLQVIAPMITQYQLEANPNAGAAAEDIDGDTGFGDVDLGIWFVPQNLKKVPFVFSALYHIASGRSPYEVSTCDGILGRNQPLSSGLGYSYFAFSAKSDINIAAGFSTSVMLGYRYNRYFIQEGTEPTSKMGDVMSAAARVLYQHRFFSFSLAATLMRSFDNIEDNYNRRDSGQSLFSLSPRAALNVPGIPFLKMLNIGYIAPLSGKNMIYPNFLFVGADFEI